MLVAVVYLMLCQTGWRLAWSSLFHLQLLLNSIVIVALLFFVKSGGSIAALLLSWKVLLHMRLLLHRCGPWAHLALTGLIRSCGGST